jgi:hypothetical protein
MQIEPPWSLILLTVVSDMLAICVMTCTKGNYKGYRTSSILFWLELLKRSGEVVIFASGYIMATWEQGLFLRDLAAIESLGDLIFLLFCLWAISKGNSEPEQFWKQNVEYV